MNTSRERAVDLDKTDGLHHLRSQFIFPTKQSLKSEHLFASDSNVKETQTDENLSIYLCGNSLGLQPRRVAEYQAKYLQTWAAKGVFGHFKEIKDSPLPPWLHVDDAPRSAMARLVGARPNEVAIMQSLTANLHLAMASFYRPTKDRHKILLERKAFPSDHFAVESQILHHGYDPKMSMVIVASPEPEKSAWVPTQHILDTITQNAESVAIILLPGIQYYSGQFLDIPTITRHAHSYGIPIGWDLAHAVGNVPLQLHDWNADFAVWCTYKYLNCGPGTTGGLFVHDAHSGVHQPNSNSLREASHSIGGNPTGWLTDGEVERGYRNRLSGWWGSQKASRFVMDPYFQPFSSATGWQLSNPSVFDCTSISASLSVFEQTSMEELREKSLKLTGYLEEQLRQFSGPFKIITPTDPAQRGAQLSIKLDGGFLDCVMTKLEEEGVVVDERQPDVIRVAPAPLYNSFEDVWRFVSIFKKVIQSFDPQTGTHVNGTSK